MFAGREFALGAAARLFGLAASLIPFLGLPLPAQAQEEGPTTIYELIEVVPDAPWDIQWKSVQDGAITQAGKDYMAEFTWDPPP